MTAVTGATLTVQTAPARYIQGFQAACLVVGGIGLVAVACAFVPEQGKESRLKKALHLDLTAQARTER
jgi:hypothetical protein